MELYSTLIPIASNTSCGYHRICLPMEHAGSVVYPDYKPAFLKKDKVLFFNRVIPFETENRFILDLDDYWDLPDTNPHKRAWKDQRMAERICANIIKAECVLVTNRNLADKVLEVRGSSKDIHIVPNALPFDEGQFKRTTQMAGYVYAGGISHQEDVKEIRHLPVKFYGGLNGSISYPFNRYMMVYDTKLASLVPLQKNVFNYCKSNLKILEAGAKGIGCVASAVEPYLNDVDKNVMFYGFDKIPTVRDFKDQGKALAEHVRQHYHLKNINHQRLQILNQYVK